MGSKERHGMIALLVALLATALAGCGSNSGGTALLPQAPRALTFVTASTFDGNLIAAEGTGKANGILAADALCMKDADYPGTGTYKALIVDGTNRRASVSPNAGDGHVDWVLKPNVNYYQSDGRTLVMTTDGKGLFVFGTLKHPFDPNGADTYWTGLSPDWTTYPDTNGSNQNCAGWSYNTSWWPPFGTFGQGGVTDAKAIYGAFGVPCNVKSYHLVCIEQ